MRLLVVTGLCGLLLSMFAVHFAATYASTTHLCVSSVPPMTTATPTIPTPTQGLVVINEVLLDPATIWNCDSRSSNDYRENAWIEIYNPQNYAIDLYAERAAIDTRQDSQPYTLPFGTVIQAHGFLIVFPFTNPNFAPTYFSNPQPLMVRLDLNYTPFDQVTVPVLSSDLSYARTTDGGNKWEVAGQPTINSSNVPIQATKSPTQKAKATVSTSKKAKTKKVHIKKGTTEKVQDQGTSNVETPRNEVNVQQPAWPQIRLPGSQTVTSSPDQTSSPSPSAAPAEVTELSFLQKILLTILAVLLVVSLFWLSHFLLRSRRLIVSQ